tara:strand:- start:179 stop:376 length:198 start_codon:yes stop_codon:yes gene_type:complete
MNPTMLVIPSRYGFIDENRKISSLDRAINNIVRLPTSNALPIQSMVDFLREGLGKTKIQSDIRAT